MSQSIASDIDSLLKDKLFQVIGSTPRSVAESLKKVDLKDKTKEGVQMFAIAVFASAVNKSTLETFMADSRFADVRPLINAAMSIQGRANMTAMTLLGHCLLTTSAASSVSFTKEFRKKMGQNDLWSGEFTSGSLSDKQREILKEKKRLTDHEEAKALGSGFLKLTGIDKAAMTALESEIFGITASEPVPAPVGPTYASGGTSSRNRMRPTSPPDAPIGTVPFATSTTSQIEVPEDVMTYRRTVLRQSDADIAESINRRGLENFINSTRTAMARDPDGRTFRSASTVGGQ
jgi:hypothetical protein